MDTVADLLPVLGLGITAGPLEPRGVTEDDLVHPEDLVRGPRGLTSEGLPASRRSIGLHPTEGELTVTTQTAHRAAREPIALAPLDDLTSRPLQARDAQPVYELMAASELEATGEVAIEEADIVSDWQRPSFDLATQSVGVFDGPRLVGYAEVSMGRRADAAVAAAYRGRGIGTALALWTQAVSRRDGKGLVGMPVPQGSPGEHLLADLGYQVAWTSWVLEIPAGAAIEPQPIPAGYEIRTADGEDDCRKAHEVIEDAFLEWSERERETYEDFAASTIKRPGFEPWNLRLMTDPSGEVVGASLVLLADEFGYVDRLAVRKDQRGRGLARALLVDSFALAHEHGATRSELSTDSRTGALGLYERVGMQIRSTWRHWAVDTSDQM